MRAGSRTFILIATVVVLLATPWHARADEADNFTCRPRLSRDSIGELDAWVNARIQEAIDRANRRGAAACDASCLSRELQRAVGGNYLHPVTLIPHSRFSKWVKRQQDIERCHVPFRETIYGARAYDRPWLFPFTGRIIFVADSIRLSGHVVGIDKIDHFIREGLAHWRAIDRHGGDIASSLAREVGTPGSGFRWTEYGLKGMALTGVFAYADLAAGYFGYRFWDDLLSLGRAGSFVGYDAVSGRFTQRREFTFAAYVNGAWDESINCSVFHPALAREVASSLVSRSLTCPASSELALAELPDADLYVNPIHLAELRSSNFEASPIHSDPMSRAIELGLDTFGDVTLDRDGRLGSQAQALRDVIEQAVLAESVGVDCFGVGEHHRPDFSISAPEVVLGAIAGRTRRMILGSAVTVLSTDDPVRVFQRFSTLNAISNGRAEVILGRGSFTESYPLFGYDLSRYEALFEEKLALFAQLVKGGPVSWKGQSRSALTNQIVYPPIETGRLRTWIGVGGSPESVVRAARHGLPLTLAIIGGSPHRFLPFVQLYYESLERYGQSKLPIAVHSPGHVAATDEQAKTEVWPHYEAMMTRIGAERGWPPATRAQFEREVGPYGALCVGSPDTVAAKIAQTVKALGLSRFDLKYSNGTLPHDSLMASIELFGTKVAPRVRELAA